MDKNKLFWWQMQTDPYLGSVVDFLGKKREEISEEAVLLSMVRTSKIVLRKDDSTSS